LRFQRRSSRVEEVAGTSRKRRKIRTMIKQHSHPQLLTDPFVAIGFEPGRDLGTP
jgi:hypothetical protein